MYCQHMEPKSISPSGIRAQQQSYVKYVAKC